MHTFLDNLHQSGKYSAQLASHQAELRREETYPDQKCLNISSLQTDYLNLDNSVSGSSRHNERSHSVQKKCTFFELNNHYAGFFSKGSDRKRKNLARLVFHITKIRIFQIGNDLDADLKIIWSQNFPSHLKTVRKDAILKNLRKKVIVHTTTAMMTTTLKYTHIWHECLVMTNAKVSTMATVRNWPIGFWIQELRAIWRRKLRTSFQDH